MKMKLLQRRQHAARESVEDILFALNGNQRNIKKSVVNP